MLKSQAMAMGFQTQVLGKSMKPMGYVWIRQPLFPGSWGSSPQLVHQFIGFPSEIWGTRPGNSHSSRLFLIASPPERASKPPPGGFLAQKTANGGLNGEKKQIEHVEKHR
jgi:hypothetical protein